MDPRTQNRYYLSMWRAFALLAAMQLWGCKTPIQAPDNIEEMMNYGFVHYTDDVEYTTALAANLVPWLQSHLDEAEEGWQVNSLSNENLDAVGIEDPNVQGIVGAAAAMPYVSSLEKLAAGLTWPDKREIFDHYVDYQVTEESDRDCFLARECLVYWSDIYQEVSFSILGTGVQTIHNEYHWIDRGEDLGWLLLMRVLAPDPIEFSSNVLEVNQQYGYAFMYVADGVTQRMEAFWIDGRFLSADLPESYAVNQAIRQMGKSRDQLDAFLADYSP